jgi:hypothetical protein
MGDYARSLGLGSGVGGANLGVVIVVLLVGGLAIQGVGKGPGRGVVDGAGDSVVRAGGGSVKVSLGPGIPFSERALGSAVLEVGDVLGSEGEEGDGSTEHLVEQL